MILAIPVPAAEQRQVYIPVSLPKRAAKKISRATYPNDVRVVGTPEQWTKTRKGGATYLEHTILVSPAQVDIPYDSEPYEAPTGDAPTFAIVTPWGIWGKCRDDTNGTLIHYGEATYWCFYAKSRDSWEHSESGPADQIPSEDYQPIEVPNEFPTTENYMWENLAEQPNSNVIEILKAIEDQSKISTLYELVREMRNKTEHQGLSVERFANMVFNNKEVGELLSSMRDKFKGALSWVGNFIGLFTGPFRFVIYVLIAIIAIIIIGITYKVLKLFICVATPVGYAARAGIYYAGEIPRDFMGLARTSRKAWDWSSNQIRRALRGTGKRVQRMAHRQRVPLRQSEEIELRQLLPYQLDQSEVEHRPPSNRYERLERASRARRSEQQAAAQAPSYSEATPTESLIDRVHERTRRLFGKRDSPATRPNVRFERD